ncbi:response regulator [Actinophytocola sp.]|uniref:response regulator n=1 Tax=Actinophytocola sp. TaxID=1872138 RepID=UPI002ED539C7
MNRTVLCIEDDPINIDLMRQLLHRRSGTVVHQASTAEDGIEAARTEQPALILLDNRLPDATGREVLRRLASSPTTATIPVVVISGDSGREAVAELLASGASGFLSKPFDIRQFMTVVEQYLA